MPTTATHTYTGKKLEPYMAPDTARTHAVGWKATAANIPLGTVVGQVTATGLWSAYAGGNVDGTEVARGIAVFDMQIGATGKVTYSATALQVGGEHGEVYNSAPVYMSGIFRTNDLVGLDAAAVADLGGFLISGTVTDGILQFG